MNRHGNFGQRVPIWDSNCNGRNRAKLYKTNPFNGVTQRFPANSHPNNFNRYAFQRPGLPPQPHQPLYGSVPPIQPGPSNGAGPLAIFGPGCPRPQQVFNVLRDVQSPHSICIPDFPGGVRPHFPSPFQNRCHIDGGRGQQRSRCRQPLLPLPPRPPILNESMHLRDQGQNVNFQRKMSVTISRPEMENIDGFQPIGFFKGYVTVKNHANETDREGESGDNPNIQNSSTKDKEQEAKWSPPFSIVNSKKRENAIKKRLLEYPQLSTATNDILPYMDEDTEVLAYFEVDIRLYYKKALVKETWSHVMFLTKPSGLSFTWILALSKRISQKADSDSNPNHLVFRRDINRFMNLQVISARSVSLECEDRLDECAEFNFRDVPECQRFQNLFFSHKSYDRKRPSNEGMTSDESESSEKRCSYNNKSKSSNQKKSEPVAWITKLPPEIARFHANSTSEDSFKPSSAATKIRSTDDFIYDSSTFSNALNISVSDKLDCYNNDSKEVDKNTSNGYGKESLKKMINEEIVFEAKNVCLLMKRDPDSSDYRSPGFGTLSIIQNSNNYNQVSFTDSNGVLKCSHYINSENIIKRKNSPGEDDFCVWQGFAEIFNSPIPLRCNMHFKVVLPSMDVERFMDAMDDSIAKSNRLDRFDTFTFNKEDTYSSKTKISGHYSM